MRRLLQGRAGLLENLAGDVIGILHHDAAGVDHFEAAAPVIGDALNAVARDAGLVADNGAALPGDAIEQGGFSDVRPAHDHHGGQRPGR